MPRGSGGPYCPPIVQRRHTPSARPATTAQAAAETDQVLRKIATGTAGRRPGQSECGRLKPAPAQVPQNVTGTSSPGRGGRA